MKDDKTGLVPRLRFPEFRGDPPFTKKKLRDLLFETKKRNRELRFGKNDVLSVSGDYGCVNQIKFLGRSYAGVSVQEYHIVETGDIVYTKSPLKKNPYGIIKENKGNPGIVSTLYAVYRPTELCRADYLDHYFSRDFNLNSYLQPLVNKGAKNDMKVKNSDVLLGTIFIPKPEEQQKIADCLSSLDALIAAQVDKLEALKTHKKGLMQQLFPREGETVPRLRFPEFREAGEWNPKLLGCLCDKISSGKDSSDTEGSYNLYGSTGVIGKTSNFSFDGIYILVARVGANAGLLTKAQGKFGVTDNTLVLHLKDAESIDFIFHWLDRVGLNKFVFGSGQPLVTGKQLKELELCFPSQCEQQKIADCLSSLDTLIATQTEKLTALKDHKKGLMQQLFPSPEVTP